MTDPNAIRVLLVEDDDLRVTTRLVLERQGFEVLTAADGITLVRRLRGTPRLADLPVLLLTARDLPFDQVGGLDAAADDYVVKPFDSEVLAARIRALVRRRPAGRPRRPPAPATSRSTSPACR